MWYRMDGMKWLIKGSKKSSLFKNSFCLNIGVANIHLHLLVTQFCLHWPAAVEHTSVRHVKKIWREREKEREQNTSDWITVVSWKLPNCHKHPEAGRAEVTLWGFGRHLGVLRVGVSSFRHSGRAVWGRGQENREHNPLNVVGMWGRKQPRFTSAGTAEQQWEKNKHT